MRDNLLRQRGVTAFKGGYKYRTNGATELDARTGYFYCATLNSPALEIKVYDKTSQYGGTAKDSDGNYLDGAKHYTLTVPANVPAVDFWSVTVYNSQTRSMIQNPVGRPSISTYNNPVQNQDGTYTLHFAPALPEGVNEINWIQTNSDEGWNTLSRVYGAKKEWFDKSWKLNDIEPVE